MPCTSEGGLGQRKSGPVGGRRAGGCVHAELFADGTTYTGGVPITNLPERDNTGGTYARGGGSGGLKAAGAEGGGGAGGSGGVGFGTLSLGAEHGAFHSRKQIALDKLTAVLMAHCKPSSADKHSLPRMWYISVCRLLPKLSMISSNCSRAPWVTNRAYAISLRQKLHTGHWQLRHMNDKLIDDNCTASHLHALCTDSCFSSQVRINKHVAGMNCASQSVSRQLRQSPSLVNMIQHTD